MGGEQMALIGMVIGGITGTVFMLIWLVYGAMILFALGSFAVHGLGTP